MTTCDNKELERKITCFFSLFLSSQSLIIFIVTLYKPEVRPLCWLHLVTTFGFEWGETQQHWCILRGGSFSFLIALVPSLFRLISILNTIIEATACRVFPAQHKYPTHPNPFLKVKNPRGFPRSVLPGKVNIWPLMRAASAVPWRTSVFAANFFFLIKATKLFHAPGRFKVLCCVSAMLLFVDDSVCCAPLWR